MTVSNLGNSYSGDVTGLTELFEQISVRDNWVNARLKANNDISLCAKIFADQSSYGVNFGRVSKIAMVSESARQAQSDYFADCKLNYDRGWDVVPEGEWINIMNRILEILGDDPLPVGFYEAKKFLKESEQKITK